MVFGVAMFRLTTIMLKKMKMRSVVRIPDLSKEPVIMTAHVRVHGHRDLQ